jgi:hypothetical protein
MLVRGDVAHAASKALAVFQRAQLLEGTHGNVAVAADAPAPAHAVPGCEVEDAVAKVGLGDGAKASGRAARRHPAHLVGRHVRRVDEAPAFVHLDQVGDPRERRDAMGPRHASTSPVCSERCMWIGIPGSISLALATALREHHGVDGPYGVRRDAHAETGTAPMPRRELSRERDDRLDVPAEAALRIIQRAVTEAAIRIEHGQHA